MSSISVSALCSDKPIIFFDVYKDKFQKEFQKMIGHTLQNYILSIFPYFIYSSQLSRLERLTRRFGNLTNFIALLGGKIKSKQVLSGHMSDILSSIYLSYSLS